MLYGFAKKGNTAYGWVRPIDLKVHPRRVVFGDLWVMAFAFPSLSPLDEQQHSQILGRSEILNLFHELMKP